MQCAAFSQVPLDGLYLLCDKLGKLFGKSPPPTHTHLCILSGIGQGAQCAVHNRHKCGVKKKIIFICLHLLHSHPHIFYRDLR